MHIFRAMNADFETYGLSAQAEAKAENWFAFVERTLSRFLPQSELSALNRSEGKPFLASALLYQAVAEGERFFCETGGLFNPYLGKVMKELGYASSFERLADGLAAVYEGARVIHGAGLTTSPVKLNPAMRSVTLGQGVSVDLGGIAKGWSAWQMARMLKRDGVLMGAINAGGDIALWGMPPGGWEVGVADPFHAGKDRLTLRVQGPAGIATSSTLKRRWRDAAGREHHHIVDPRSGRSGTSDLVQVTLLAPDLTTAEAYAKCVLLLGSTAGFAWLTARQPGCAAIGIRHDGSLAIGGDLNQFCAKGAPDYESIS